ncbi:MAG: metallophosphoesterase [Ignavibacteriales bacterium]|nr:MAG: serine/threonine protein phosphatase [Ignavibacteriaceae bacterium]MBW7871810.1 serine/threonine protein phosphatase [Ignavibacteria bacterium]MCZ2144340.1 metallophosphoesterase [Ignavibacteriales bacterium]OQY75519.1 MAG: hypothetical protein B6D45_05585 [Ignavibacteriales bacterium UTCHB3]MBV6446293.1 Serine/threonine-protein phosphatase 1 [Ignavibacteriaceae bacterium]
MFAVIGDIHGCYYTLKNLYDKLTDIYGEFDVYATGDLVDRGRHSFKVLEFVIEKGIVPVLGNHDMMFLSYFRDPESPAAVAWNMNSSGSILSDYKESPEALGRHCNFIADMPLFVSLENHLISHAGVNKQWLGVLNEDGSLNDDALLEIGTKLINDPHGLLWNRDEILNVGKVQIVGHTPVSNFRYSPSNHVYYIDTGAATGNKLTAIVFEDEGEIDIHFQPADPRDIGSMRFR